MEETKVTTIEEPVEEVSYQRPGFWKDNRGVGVIEIVLILVIIFTIYRGCK